MNWSKFPSLKALRRIEWVVRGILVLSIGLNCYTLIKTGRLLAPTWFCLGFNVAAFFWGGMLRRMNKRNDELWAIVWDQQKTNAHLFSLLDGNKQAAGYPKSPVNPTRN